MSPGARQRSLLAEDPATSAAGRARDVAAEDDPAVLHEAACRPAPPGAGDSHEADRAGGKRRASFDAAGATPEARLQRALDLGYRHLGKRDRTEAEVRRHLEAREVDDVSIDGAIEALVRQRYVDDERYARTFAQDRRALDDWGPERIERRLLELGVAPGLVAGALADRDATDELGAAVALLRRRFRETPADDRERDRALRMLVRKGYDLDLAYEAVRAFCGKDA